jgi:hypothetical protein
MTNMFRPDWDPFDHIQYLDMTVIKLSEELEEMSALLAQQSKYLEILTFNYRHQAHELQQQRMYIQLLDQRINQLELLK